VRVASPRRPTDEVLILLMAATICFAIIATGTGLFIVAIVDPERDLTRAFQAVATVLNTLLGLVLGYLIGRRGIRNGNNGSR